MLCRGDGHRTRYTLRCNMASIMKGFGFYEYKGVYHHFEELVILYDISPQKN